nr:nodulation protein [Melilotus officinalis]
MSHTISVIKNSLTEAVNKPIRPVWKLRGPKLLFSNLGAKIATTNTTSNKKIAYPLIFQTSVSQSHKHDVFVSFRGPDIREGFLSHLVELPKGDEISQSLFQAIETSLISLVIFSQNYASSHWCLDELVKIIQCKQKDGQIVLPVFYKVDPTIVRHQRGTYANAFAEHEKNYNLTRVQQWRSALKDSGGITGFHSAKFWDDAELVEKIVKCVLRRLGHVRLVDSKGLIGIGKQISHVESLLQVESQDVRAIGIWGMSGIGKTTIAEEVYNRLCSEYDACYFKANVREEWGRHGNIYLKKELFSTLLGEPDLKIDTPHGLPSFVKRRLLRMKVLVVLDDVNDPHQLETLIGTHDWFGTGSRIIITTTDKQVLSRRVVDIYEVKALDFDDSLRLFNLYAFEQNHTEMKYCELSKRMVKYAKGIPLVLEVLGRHLRAKDKNIWESQLKKLKKVPIKKVHDIVRLSYDDLDRHEKKILLDIACFLDGLHMKVDDIKLLVKDGAYSVDVELESLKNKALITISSDNVVSMHSIIQETAWEIVREESIDDPGNRSRLLDPDDIYQVLKTNKGSEAIRSIAADLSMMKELQLNTKVFAKMSKLQYLDIYSKGCCGVFPIHRQSLYLPKGLESLPNELRYLRWSHYPLESLPSKFNGKKLVVLNLRYSKVKKLWHKKKDLENLKYLILGVSSHLVELPDLSKATDLAIIDLRLCVGLTRIHPSVFSLNKLEKLDLGGCFSLTKLRSKIHLSSLRYLSLAGCIALKDFSVTSKNMVKLNLEHTGIRKLPSSIGLQTKIEKLLLAHSYIKKLPKSVKHLSRMRRLDLHHCMELQSLPELPSSLKTLDASGCVSLETVTFPSILNAQINMMKFAHRLISTSRDHKYDVRQGTYVYPSSSVPEWLVYRTTHDYMTIDDLSFMNHSSPLAIIFCFIVPQVQSQGFILRFNISVGEGENIQVYLDRPSLGIKSDHVYLMCDRGLSRYLNSRVKTQPMFKVKVTAESGTPASGYVPIMLRGVGVSPINISKYQNFIQQMKMAKGPNITISLCTKFYTILLAIFIVFVSKRLFFSYQ